MQGLTQNVVVGEWYRTGTESPFEVVALDLDHETIEVQHFDGTVEEIDFDSWAELAPKPTAAPEDYSGAMDLDREDYGLEPEVIRSDTRDNPLDYIDQL